MAPPAVSRLRRRHDGEYMDVQRMPEPQLLQHAGLQYAAA